MARKRKAPTPADEADCTLRDARVIVPLILSIVRAVLSLVSIFKKKGKRK